MTHFASRVCSAGYQRVWRKVEIDGGLSKSPEWVLVPNVPPQVVGETRLCTRYPDGLFLEFANLPPDEGTAHLAFANQYGQLGLTVQVEEDTGLSSIVTLTRPGERHEDWRSSIKAMKRAVRLWELWQGKDLDALKKVLRPYRAAPQFDAIGYWWYSDQAETPPYSDATPIFPDGGVQFSEDDVLTPTVLILSRWVNRGLQGNVQQAMMYDPKRKQPTLRTRANSLLGLMWSQLGRSITRGEIVVPCESCQQPFLVNPDADGRTARKRFCSDACKLKAHRKRQAEVVRLAEEGLAPKQIAEQTSTPAATVKKWIRKTKKDQRSRTND